MSRGHLRVEFVVHWSKRYAQVLVSDNDGLILTDDIEAVDDASFRDSIQHELRHYAPLPVRVSTVC